MTRPLDLGVCLEHNAGNTKVAVMELHPLVYHEWREDHVLSKRSLIWIRDHAEPGDLHPLRTAIDQLHTERADRLDP